MTLSEGQGAKDNFIAKTWDNCIVTRRGNCTTKNLKIIRILERFKIRGMLLLHQKGRSILCN